LGRGLSVCFGVGLIEDVFYAGGRVVPGGWVPRCCVFPRANENPP